MKFRELAITLESELVPWMIVLYSSLYCNFPWRLRSSATLRRLVLVYNGRHFGYTSLNLRSHNGSDETPCIVLKL